MWSSPKPTSPRSTPRPIPTARTSDLSSFAARRLWHWPMRSMKGRPMRPDSNAKNILSTTRATAKMHEFRVAPEDFIALPRNPAMLLALAVGLLGDVAATLANPPEGSVSALVGELPVPPSWGPSGPSSIEGLRFASVFFDAFLNARLDDTITVELSLLCGSAYYLAGDVGSLRRLRYVAYRYCCWRPVARAFGGDPDADQCDPH